MEPIRRTTAARARRQTILDAALACFLEDGPNRTTVEEIRARSGASIGSIYHHFGGKEQIALALYRELLADYHAGFLRELERNADARTGIGAVVRYHLWWIGEHRDWGRYLFHQREVEALSVADDGIRSARRAYYRAINAWLAPFIERGVVRRLPADLLTVLWFGPAHEFERLWLAGRTTTPLDRAGDRLAEAAWAALHAAPADSPPPVIP